VSSKNFGFLYNRQFFSLFAFYLHLFTFSSNKSFPASFIHLNLGHPTFLLPLGLLWHILGCASFVYSDQIPQQSHSCAFNYHIRSFPSFPQLMIGYNTINPCPVTDPHIFKIFFSHIYYMYKMIVHVCVSRYLFFIHSKSWHPFLQNLAWWERTFFRRFHTHKDK
jgi:hypothetical protein